MTNPDYHPPPELEFLMEDFVWWTLCGACVRCGPQGYRLVTNFVQWQTFDFQLESRINLQNATLDFIPPLLGQYGKLPCTTLGLS